MEKVTWNKLLYQQNYFRHLIIEFLKSKPLNQSKLLIITAWLEQLLSEVRKETDNDTN